MPAEKHAALKSKILHAVSEAYEKTLATDEQRQQQKPDLLKHVDAQLDVLLRPLFT